jgi:hypothetical protein
MLRTVLFSTAAIAFAVTGAVAAPTNSKLPNGVAVTSVAGGHVTSFSGTNAPKKGVIFDSIGSGYNCCNGWTISGPSSQIGEQIWLATQVTPSGKGKVTSIAVGVGYVNGSNAAELAIYADASGIPGKMLWSGDVSNLPVFGTTSTATVGGKVKKVKLKANAPIWVAVQTDANSSNTWDAWDQSLTTNETLASNTGSGWVSDGTGAAGAMTIYGKVKK